MDIITGEMIKENSEDLLSYPNIRKALNRAIRKAPGRDKMYLQELRDILDMVSETALHASNQEKIESEIYSILS